MLSHTRKRFNNVGILELDLKIAQHLAVGDLICLDAPLRQLTCVVTEQPAANEDCVNGRKGLQSRPKYAHLPTVTPANYSHGGFTQRMTSYFGGFVGLKDCKYAYKGPELIHVERSEFSTVDLIQQQPSTLPDAAHLHVTCNAHFYAIRRSKSHQLNGRSNTGAPRQITRALQTRAGPGRYFQVFSSSDLSGTPGYVHVSCSVNFQVSGFYMPSTDGWVLKFSASGFQVPGIVMRSSNDNCCLRAMS